MQCPHCLVVFLGQEKTVTIDNDIESVWEIAAYKCPSCERLILYLVKRDIVTDFGSLRELAKDVKTLIHPKTSRRSTPPPEVPREFVTDYLEACLVLADSPKASAALSRRCLQHILREKAGVKHGDLAKEIREAIDNGELPNHISESLDAIRNIGNFAAHPNKSNSTGEILSVEPGEAEWSLEVIEMLHDFYFVQPESAKQKRKALNQKLADAGKPPMK